MRIVFMGTPDFAVPTLDALAASEHEVAAVYTQPPRPAGRGKTATPSPVQVRAQALDIPVHSPVSLKDPAAQATLAALEPDALVVAAYGLILPQAVLDMPVWESVNVHASLLPRWRGAAPVQRAILAGDEETGVTIMAMAAGLDTGDMLATARTSVGTSDAGALTAELARIGADLLLRVLGDPAAYEPRPQPEAGVTYAAKIDKAEAALDFTRPAEAVARQVQAFAPRPGAWLSYRGERIRLLAAEVVSGSGAPGIVLDDRLTIACGNGAIRPSRVQRAGKAAMDAADLLRGLAIPAGTDLTAEPKG